VPKSSRASFVSASPAENTVLYIYSGYSFFSSFCIDVVVFLCVCNLWILSMWLILPQRK
jgi:hypothetical protein